MPLESYMVCLGMYLIATCSELCIAACLARNTMPNLPLPVLEVIIGVSQTLQMYMSCDDSPKAWMFTNASGFRGVSLTVGGAIQSKLELAC